MSLDKEVFYTMAKQKLLYWSNYTPPCPSTYNGTTATVVDSGRNVKGVTVGGVVREGVAAVDVTFNYITTKEWSKILSQFNSKLGGSFYRKTTFFNQETNQLETRTFYVGDRTTNGLHLLDKNGKPQGWLGAKLSLVEK